MNIIRTPNIFNINHLLDEIERKYRSSSSWAASTFKWASSTFESILFTKQQKLNKNIKQHLVNLIETNEKRTEKTNTMKEKKNGDMNKWEQISKLISNSIQQFFLLEGYVIHFDEFFPHCWTIELISKVQAQ